MSNRPAKNTKADIKRAAEVAQKLGMSVKIWPTGTIELVTPETTQQPAPTTEAAPLF